MGNLWDQVTWTHDSNCHAKAQTEVTIQLQFKHFTFVVFVMWTGLCMYVLLYLNLLGFSSSACFLCALLSLLDFVVFDSFDSESDASGCVLSRRVRHSRSWHVLISTLCSTALAHCKGRYKLSSRLSMTNHQHMREHWHWWGWNKKHTHINKIFIYPSLW